MTTASRRRAASGAAKGGDARVGLIRAVRAACRAKGIEDDDRRALQAEVIGKRSLGDMDVAELGRVLDHLNGGRSAPMAHRPHVGKIRALWWSLYWLGGVDSPEPAALDHFVRRQTGRSALRFLGHHQAASVVEALKAMIAREGVRWPEQPGAIGDRVAVLTALWAKLQAAQDLPYDVPAAIRDWCLASLGRDRATVPAWSARELDAAIRHFGRLHRKARGLTP